MGDMMRAWRRSFVLGVGSSLLGAMVLCPLMAAAAAMPAAASCHDGPAEDHHGETSAFTCCAPLVTVAKLKAAPEAVTALPPAVETAPHAAPQAEWRTDRPRPRTVSPPLFVQHASLLI